MFDFHIHTKLSFDGKETALAMAQAALGKGLKEICFTDHLDFDPLEPARKLHFTIEEYRLIFDELKVAGIEIRRGVEFGMLPDNTAVADAFLKQYPFDYVIGSAHFIDGYDPYFPEFWQGKTQEYAELRYLEGVLSCVLEHNNFDSLGHLTYICKTYPNPTNRPVPYEAYREVVDEILKHLVQMGKGLEVNTSGLARSGDYMPQEIYLRRFKELGGELVTVGSDAHDAHRVGDHCYEAALLVQDIFGYVCTFRGRKPVFHRI